MSKRRRRQDDGFYVHIPHESIILESTARNRLNRLKPSGAFATQPIARSDVHVSASEEEDLDTLARASQVDEFSYVMGEDLSGVQVPSPPDGERDGVRVAVPAKNINTERDPLLNNGWVYFVEKGPYIEHLKKFINEEEMSTCSGFAAMFLANLKNVRGLQTTGVVGCTCARHGVWKGRRFGNLQRGERYCNVDGVIVQALSDVEVEVAISYDIVCQWGVHFWERMEEFPDDARLKITEDALVLCMPKFHLWAHKPDCHACYSFNFLPGAGQTHGETIEENWSASNKASAQMKMMGPGAREDTLDNVFGFHNFQTIESLGQVLGNHMVKAIKEASVHWEDFEQFNEGVVSYCGEPAVAAWLASIKRWEADHSKPCPYEAKLQGKETMQEVELALIREEHAAIATALSVS
ncbi:uncharacterized protein ARMOST_04139 [Armillaria ostoyae]|uniref:CxC2-like cysteine cluster KDZ transposase-associated domain-containing protein n=1 Tax=Armillaria ostoyae TaxID=47428 RepID=A0A284QWI2_ARMOS|nr:uncharacterized protein ARMOST_04139 [Armillaria ostoyae]